MTSTVSASNNTAGLTGSTATPNKALSDANASQDRFLKLLVAQLNNQDPMNPMDNAQMTSQMAQINTVTGIQQLNETMKSFGAQFSSMQAMQGTAMIGRDVLVQSNSLSINGGRAGGAIDIPVNADKVAVEILSPGGQVLETIHLGSKAPGRHSFEWDASSYTGVGSPSFKVTATSGNSTVPTESFARDTIVSIGTNGVSMNVQLKGRDSVAYNAIQAIM
jgi:flagellar basal-body rod modification protein FlgD